MDTPTFTILQPVVTAAQWTDTDKHAIHATIDGYDLTVPDDPANSDRRAISGWEAKGNVIADYVAPAPVVVVPDFISDRQFAQQAAIMGLITPDEALAWVGPGTIPPSMLALVETLPEDMQFAAKMLLTGATTFERTNAVTEQLVARFGWTEEERDAFWTAAAAL